MELPNVIPHNGNTSSADPDCSMFQLQSRMTTDRDSYVLDIALERQFSMSLAVSLSNRAIKVFKIDQQMCIRELQGHDKPITRVKFSNENSNMLFSGSLDGTINVWDLRIKNSKSQEFVDDTGDCRKAITTFDFNCEENYVCAGTELIREDAFLLFWDRRTSKILGGYWNSHTDDVTEVQFHPSKRNIMVSGSVDGLINVYDLNKPCEDDALLNTLNTCSSVGKVMWKVKADEELEEDNLSCLTHTEEIQLWNIASANPSILLDREFLKKQSGIGIDYLVDTFDDKNVLYLVSGNHSGDVQVWEVSETRTFVKAQLNSGHKDDVRAVTFNSTNQVIYTGGEDGVVCVWKKIDSPSKDKYKMESHMKKLSLKQLNPY